MPIKYTAHRKVKIPWTAPDHRFDLYMAGRTGDELAWRAYMVRVHGGWVNDAGILRGPAGHAKAVAS
jgi:hypothetical protein